MARKSMQQLMRAICLLLVASCLISCTTPGTYMGPNDMKKPIRSNGMLYYPDFIPITPELFNCDNNLFHRYRVGAQDILTIIVWNHPELTIPSMVTTSENVNVYTHFNEFNNNAVGILVNEQGQIFFPLAGKIKVSGLTVDQIRNRLTKRLVRYIRNPQVSVRVSAFRNKYIYIIGEVLKPGIQPITDMPMTIMDAINQSGGIDKESSNARFIYVIRGDFRNPKVFWLDATSPGALLMAASFQLEARDVVMVATAGVARWARLVNKILPTIQTFVQAPVNMRTDTN